MEKLGSDVARAFDLLHKKDPEGRNVIVLCLTHSSWLVLESIYEMFGSTYDMKQQILKQSYDSNPCFNMAMSLCAFEQFKERSLKTV